MADKLSFKGILCDQRYRRLRILMHCHRPWCCWNRKKQLQSL